MGRASQGEQAKPETGGENMEEGFQQEADQGPKKYKKAFTVDPDEPMPLTHKYVSLDRKLREANVIGCVNVPKDNITYCMVLVDGHWPTDWQPRVEDTEIWIRDTVRS
mmetsp:Transcript_11894/g.29800  ORF Transcript_11894/g.29800 Transcript_11894/m.29800 type:complete len:108 (-) Transcript_11894:126-449(-)